MSSPAINSTLPPNRWAALGFTTTAQERIGPGPPYTYPALQVNLFFRVFLGLVSLFVTWIPARLLWRNGEFSGAVLCVTLMMINFLTVVNALIWRDNNVQEWYAGYGWCDFQAYAYFGLDTAFNISLFEIHRGLACKVRLNRAVALTYSEKRRQLIISALVIFTVPFIQIVLTYFVMIGRYSISTLAGCVPIYYPSWMLLVFYVLPTPIFIVAAAVMASLTFYRYRKIERATRDALCSDDGTTAARQNRVRVKLYFITLCCIVVALPLTMVLFVSNITMGAWSQHYDFHALHFGPDPFNSHFIAFTTSDRMNFQDSAQSFIGELAGIAVFISFGTTTEALNMYRKCLLAIGLGFIFPKLKEEYTFAPGRGSRFTWWASPTRSLRVKSFVTASNSTNGSTRKSAFRATAEHFSHCSGAEKSLPTFSTQVRGLDLCTPALGIETATPQDDEKTATPSSSAHNNSSSSSNSSSNHHHNDTNPWPDLAASELDAATAAIQAREQGSSPRPTRTTTLNPFAFRVAFSPASPVRLPFLPRSRSTSAKERKQKQKQGQNSVSPWTEIPAQSHSHSQARSQAAAPGANPGVGVGVGVGVRTRVWSGPSSSSLSSSSSQEGNGANADVDLEAGQASSQSPTGGVRVETSIARRSIQEDDGHSRRRRLDGLEDSAAS
ncbi:hypothetical protein VTK56DRAFT_5699 [Thermocarpiscus australiensis]